MSAVLLSSPNQIDFSRNGLKFQIQGTAYIETPGSKGVWLINLVGSSWTSGAMEFWDFELGAKFSITPAFGADPEKNEVPILNDVKNIADAIRGIYQFNKYYTIYGDSVRLYIYTREEIYINWDTMASIPANWSNFSKGNGITPIKKSDYSLYVIVHEDNGTNLIAELQIDVNSEGQSEISIGRLIDPYIPTSMPDLNSGTLTLINIKQYVAQFAEKYKVNDLLRINNANTFRGNVLKGKLNFADYVGYDFVQRITEDKNFLLSLIDAELWDDAHYFLHFYNPLADDEQINIKCKIYYTDVTDYTTVLFTYAFNYLYPRIYQFPASINSLGLNSFNPGKEIYKYEIWIEHADTSILCAKKTFKVIDKPMFVKEFAFLNKYGVIEIFNAISKSSLKLQTKKTITKRELDVNYSKSDKQYGYTVDESFNEFEMSSGNISKDQAEAFQDVLNTTEFYEIVDGDYIACIINEDNFDIIPENEDIVSIQFTYRRAFDK
ncbi:MAG: hypothetical protein P1P88_04725 [Bacteroidales bacterium]|nr:hypothetical protein [Bacteroidales bacterium]